MLSLMRSVAQTPVLRFTPVAPPVARAFGRAFAEVCRGDTPQTSENLRLATAALVERLKSDRLPPERVIVAIKAALVRHGECLVPPSFAQDGDRFADDHGAMVYRRAFTWCLDSYYGAE